MSPIDYAAMIGGTWLLAAVVVATRLGPHLKRNQTPPEPEVNWLPYLPPVPPSPRKSDESWLDLVPSDCLVDDDPILHDRFFAIVDSESRWFA